MGDARVNKYDVNKVDAWFDDCKNNCYLLFSTEGDTAVVLDKDYYHATIINKDVSRDWFAIPYYVYNNDTKQYQYKDGGQQAWGQHLTFKKPGYAVVTHAFQASLSLPKNNTKAFSQLVDILLPMSAETAFYNGGLRVASLQVDRSQGNWCDVKDQLALTKLLITENNVENTPVDRNKDCKVFDQLKDLKVSNQLVNKVLAQWGCRFASRRDKAFICLMIGQWLMMLSSRAYYGAENNSNQAIRSIAWAWVNKAYELDEDILFNKRVIVRKVATDTCAEIIAKNLLGDINRRKEISGSAGRLYRRFCPTCWTEWKVGDNGYYDNFYD